MYKFLIVAVFISFCGYSCDDQALTTREANDNNTESLLFSRPFYLNQELGEGAVFSTTSTPSVPKFNNARVSYNFFEADFSDDLRYWAINDPAAAVVTLVPNIETPFGLKSVSHVLMNNGSGVRIYKSYDASDVPLFDFTNRDFEYSIWLFNKKSIPSRVYVKLQNRSPINGSNSTSCVIPPMQWVRCSGRMHTDSVIAFSLELSITEQQFISADGNIDMYVTNASLIDLSDQISSGLISNNVTTVNVMPKSQYVSANANDYNRPVISIGDSIYASPASGVSNQQAHSTAHGIENLGDYIDARAVGGWSVSDMYNDLVVTDPLSLDEKINSLAIISPGNNDAIDNPLEVPVQKAIVDKIVQLFTDVGNSNYLVLGVHGNSVAQNDLETTVAYNALLEDTYGNRFLNTWKKLLEISDPADQELGIISQRYRHDGLHLSEEGKMHVVQWSIERLKSLGYPNRDGSLIPVTISYQHTINDSLSYPLINFDEAAFTVVIRWSPDMSQIDLSGVNGILSVNGNADSLLYVNSLGVHSNGSAVPVTVNPSFEAGKVYTIALYGSKQGSYQIGVFDSEWQWSTENTFSTYSPDSFLQFCLSTEMTQNFEFVDIYKEDKTIQWIESVY